MAEYPNVKQHLIDHTDQIEALRMAVLAEIPATETNANLCDRVNKFFDNYKCVHACFTEYVYGLVSGNP